MLKRAALLAVAGILTLGSSLPVLAADEEVDRAGRIPCLRLNRRQ